MDSDQRKREQDEQTDAAWVRLNSALRKEERHPNWDAWSVPRQTDAGIESAEGAGAVPFVTGPVLVPAVQPEGGCAASAGAGAAGGSGWMQALRRGRKWMASAAAVCAVALVLATPAGNEALASILGKFRMQEVTTVSENDIQAIFDGMAPEGETREAANRFGTFTQTTGPDVPAGEVNAEEASRYLGQKVKLPKEGSRVRIGVTPSNAVTFQMNVAEVNAAMKRLGAVTLLPESIDGRPISLELGNRVEVRVETEEGAYTYAQQAAPVITVDPSIPVEEAAQAVLQFPLLPEPLRKSLEASNGLREGNVPLPVVIGKQTQQFTVDGVRVFVHRDRAGSGADSRYEALWVHNGMIYELNGQQALPTADAVLAKVKELMGS
ncbi:hypothetical protein ACVNS2_27700 [Paenibacillus caseinilyticus]|uniref:DUF4367 domain-containing protein n=1 Tax=Paenibacillus mucilaginosus K02 TaxID=997761 RepID=I0BQ26_9BACL|nr:hypothetical protein [Paenibacillus mucilaginosus]AFH64473.1 hypothetical protein B2K_27895 [Paenibacillus mucilaginosus K02]